MSFNIVNWNVEWATSRSGRTPEILGRIRQRGPEVVCLTESDCCLLSQDGHTICSQPDYGYGVKGGRRKVVLWSRNPWQQVDDLGSGSLPPGRFVAATTQTSLGPVTFAGICIPWFGSRATGGRKKRWEDHGDYLAGLKDVLERMSGQRLVVAGDFNQLIGSGCRAPRELQLALQEAFSSSLTIVTSGLAFEGRGSIDHIAVSADLAVESLDAIGNVQEGKRLSDHFGVFARLSIAAVP